MTYRKVALAATRTLALYGFAAWVYIALVALVHPWTLGMQLTHFTTFPHEDTFGETSFVVSLLSFFSYSILKPHEEIRRSDDVAPKATDVGRTELP